MCFIPYSNFHIQQLCKELEGTEVPREVANRVEHVFSGMLTELKQLQRENESLQDMFKK